MDDYGYFGKGLTGYAHYMEALKDSGYGGGGRRGKGGCGSGLLIIFIIIILGLSTANCS